MSDATPQQAANTIREARARAAWCRSWLNRQNVKHPQITPEWRHLLDDVDALIAALKVLEDAASRLYVLENDVHMQSVTREIDEADARTAGAVVRADTLTQALERRTDEVLAAINVSRDELNERELAALAALAVSITDAQERRSCDQRGCPNEGTERVDTNYGFLGWVCPDHFMQLKGVVSVALHHTCEKCGHMVEAHGPDGCDYEIRDYGDMDCGCRRYRVEVTGPWVKCAECGREHLEAVTDTHRRIFCERPLTAGGSSA